MDRDLIRARIAHHECGHAVIARAVGLTVTRVKIRRNGGYVRLGEFHPEQADAELRFFYAGRHAEARLLTEHGYSRARALRITKTHASHDLKQVRSIVKWMQRHHDQRLNTRRAERDAARLVDSHWNAIARMAAGHC